MADQRPAVNNAFGMIGNLLSLIIIYFLTNTTKGNLVLMSFVLSATPVAILLIASIVLYKGKYKHLKPSLHNIRWKHSGSLFALGVKFFILQIAALVIFSTSNIIIAQLLGAEQVAVYNISFKYFQIPIMLSVIIMLPIWSAVTDAFVRKDFVWLKGTLSTLNKISFLISIGIIIMLVISPFIYDYWIGERVHISFIVSASMALYAIITVINSPYSYYINGLGKLHLMLRLVMVTSLLYVPLAIILAKTSLQVAGVMLAICIINSATLPIYVIQTNKIINNQAKGIWDK